MRPRGAAIRFTGWHALDSGRGWQVSPPWRCASLPLRMPGAGNPSIGKEGELAGGHGREPSSLDSRGTYRKVLVRETRTESGPLDLSLGGKMGRRQRSSDPRELLPLATSDSGISLRAVRMCGSTLVIEYRYKIHQMPRIRLDTRHLAEDHVPS